MFWRNPASVFFTVLLPLIFLFIFATIFGNDEIEERGVKTTTYYVPAIVALAVISATMQSLAINLTRDRERGLLKQVQGRRCRGTFVAGRVGNSLVVSVLMVVLVSVIGKLVYDVSDPGLEAPRGAGHAGRRGVHLLLSRLRADRGDPLRGRGRADLNAVVLPLYFISGIFIPDSEIPGARFPPICSRSAEAFFTAWDPNTVGAGFEWGDLAVVAGWESRGCWWRYSPSAGNRAVHERGASVGSHKMMIHYVTLNVSDLERSGSFYDAILAPLGWPSSRRTAGSISWGMNKPALFILGDGGFGTVSFPAEHPRRQGLVRVGHGQRRGRGRAWQPAQGSGQLRRAPARPGLFPWSRSSPAPE